MSNTDFWKAIDEALVELRTAKSADDVLKLCPKIADMSCGDGFWPGGYDEFAEALYDAGWKLTWGEAPYHWERRAPDGSKIKYVEGDLYVTAAA